MISIVIADDEEKIRLGLAGVLAQSLTGVEIAASFGSGGALMDFLRAHDVDILITDIEMSGASGLQVLEFLRRSHRRTRVIMITAFQRFDYAMGALENHVDAFLTKPFSTQKLLDTVRALISAIQQESDSRSGRETNAREMLRLLCSAGHDLPERLFLLGEMRPLALTPCRQVSVEISGCSALDEEAQRVLDSELSAQGEINADDALCVLTDHRSGIYRFLLFATEKFDHAHYLSILENTPRRVCGLSAEIAVTPFESLPQFLLFRRFARELSAREQLLQEGNLHAASERLRAFVQSLSPEEAAAFARHLRRHEGLTVDGEAGEDCLNALENGRPQTAPDGGSLLAVKARRLIAERYTDPLLSLGQVADALGVSSAYLSRQFKRVQGVNFTEYCQSLRLERACALLRETALPINVIAEAVGYQRGSTVYFRTTFKAVYGKRPASTVRLMPGRRRHERSPHPQSPPPLDRAGCSRAAAGLCRGRRPVLQQHEPLCAPARRSDGERLCRHAAEPRLNAA